MKALKKVCHTANTFAGAGVDKSTEDLSKIFPIGSPVQIKALNNQSAYNGRYATVIEYRTNDAGQYDRINVKVDDEDKSISVKPENLVSSEELYKQWKTECIHRIAKVFRRDDNSLIRLFRRILTLMKRTTR